MLRTLVCGDRYERAARAKGAALIAGVDEVGRGALFGPVVAAAVILPPKTRLPGLRDSKLLKPSAREHLAAHIQSLALAISIAEIDAATIDRVNIYQATRLAMTAAVSRLSPAPDHLLIDAMRIDHPCPQTSIVYGDALSISIASASVVAKVYRDRLMCQLDAQFPQYGLARHKGYGTAEHRAAILEHGPSPLHRKSFAPVAQSNLFETDQFLS
ncbi:MAG: ribonuclease HII [Acidobacteria bacterium]|nr:ribonuclease HII [Acidobacteriota bacterium]